MPAQALFEYLSPAADLPGPIGEPEYEQRRARLAGLLQSFEFDALLCEHGATETYLTGRSGWLSERLSATVFLADGRQLAIAPAFEAAFLSEKLGPGVELLAWQEHEYGYAALATRLHALGVKRLGLDGAVRVGPWRRLESATSASRNGCSAGDASALVEALRSQKSAHEQALIRRACALTQQAIDAVAASLEAGLTDLEISARLHAAQRRLGLTDTWDLTLIGAKSAEPHGQADGTRLERGDVLLIDTGGVLHGYRSDLTRTFVFSGRPDGEFERAWHAVRDAQRRAFDALRPGATTGSLDQVARGVIDAAGFGPGYRLFSHRLGHGIGLEIHEPPYLDGGSRVELQPGMCFTNEPGIYQRGAFGVRLESLMCVGAEAPQVFGGWQKSPQGPEADDLAG